MTNYGVNLTRLRPGAASSLRHAHMKQDELVYVLEGHPTLHTNEGRTQLSPGMCAGFKAGTGNAHSLINETVEDVLYKVIEGFLEPVLRGKSGCFGTITYGKLRRM